MSKDMVKALGTGQTAKIDNRTYDQDQRMTMVKVYKPNEAFFGDGIPYKKKVL